MLKCLKFFLYDMLCVNLRTCFIFLSSFVTLQSRLYNYLVRNCGWDHRGRVETLYQDMSICHIASIGPFHHIPPIPNDELHLAKSCLLDQCRHEKLVPFSKDATRAKSNGGQPFLIVCCQDQLLGFYLYEVCDGSDDPIDVTVAKKDSKPAKFSYLLVMVSLLCIMCTILKLCQERGFLPYTH